MAQEYILSAEESYYPMSGTVHRRSNGEFIFVHWSYDYNTSNQSIHCKWSGNGGTTWSFAPIVEYTTSVSWRCLAAYKNDYIHILKPSADNSKFEYIVFSEEISNICDFDVPPEEVGLYSGVVDSQNNVHFLYYYDGYKYAKYNGVDGFEIVYVAEEYEYLKQILIDREDCVHIVTEKWDEDMEVYVQYYKYFGYLGDQEPTTEIIFTPQSNEDSYEYVSNDGTNAFVDDNGKIWCSTEVTQWDNDSDDLIRDRIGYITNSTGSWVFTAIVDKTPETFSNLGDMSEDWGVAISYDQNGKYLTWVTADNDNNACLFTTKIGETPQKLHTGNGNNEIYYYSPVMADNSSNFLVLYYDDTATPSNMTKFFVVQYGNTSNLTHKQIFENEFDYSKPINNQTHLFDHIQATCIVPLNIGMEHAAILCNMTTVWSQANGFYLNSRNMGQVAVCRRTDVSEPQYVYYAANTFFYAGLCAIDLEANNLEYIGLYWAEVTDCEG